MPIDLEGILAEAKLWHPTPRLRWFRPLRGDDSEKILQQMWRRASGEHEWRMVETLLED